MPRTTLIDDIEHAPTHSMRAVLKIRDFRNLWLGLGLSSFGDWLGLLAITAMANKQAGDLSSLLGNADSYELRNFAIAGVLFLRIVPALVMGPIAGWVADRLDRRWTLIVGDYLRAALFLSMPIVNSLYWVFAATVLIEAISLVWGPAKDATVPNLVPPHRLEAANQLSLITTYGSALPAAFAFVAMTLLTKGVHLTTGMFSGNPIQLALYFNALTFLVSGVIIQRLRTIPKGAAASGGDHGGSPVKVVVDGWKYAMGTPVIRGLVVGIVGAFAAGGIVIGLARTYVQDLGGGDPGYGLMFATVFLGLGLGMWRGPRLLQGLSRRRLFGVTLTLAGLLLVPLAMLNSLETATGLTIAIGFFAGVAWVTGNTMLGLEVPDELRGRTFAFVGSLIRLALALVLALGPLAAGLHRHAHGSGAQLGPRAHLQRRRLDPPGRRGPDDRCRSGVLSSDGRPEGDLAGERPAPRRGQQPGGLHGPGPLRRVRGRGGCRQVDPGRGCCSTGSPRRGTTCSSPTSRATPRSARRSARSCSTRPPARSPTAPRHCSTPPTRPSTSSASSCRRWPAVPSWSPTATSTRPSPTRAPAGAIPDNELERVARWATGDLRPHLTVLLDLPPGDGLTRFEARDRIEQESLEFHERVREAFVLMASAKPEHYLVVDATQAPADDRRPDPAPARAPARPGRPPRTGSGMSTTALDASWGLGLVGPGAGVVERRCSAAVAGDMTHAWLFTGPPGSGRSNAAIAFAAALQCERGGCGECHSCHTALVGSPRRRLGDPHPEALDRRRRGARAGAQRRARPGRATAGR